MANLTSGTKGRSSSGQGIFPPEEYTGFGFLGNVSKDYIGTWRKNVAMKIIAELRKDRFSVCARGRGRRKSKGVSGRDCPLKAATHLALYIRGSAIHELSETEIFAVAEDDGIKGISRLEAFKREMV